MNLYPGALQALYMYITWFGSVYFFVDEELSSFALLLDLLPVGSLQTTQEIIQFQFINKHGGQYRS